MDNFLSQLQIAEKRVDALKDTLAQKAFGGRGQYDESKHPRRPKGTPGGGKFAPKGNAAVATGFKPKSKGGGAGYAYENRPSIEKLADYHESQVVGGHNMFDIPMEDTGWDFEHGDGTKEMKDFIASLGMRAVDSAVFDYKDTQNMNAWLRKQPRGVPILNFGEGTDTYDLVAIAPKGAKFSRK